MGFFLIPSAGVGFFLASWITVIFWGITAPALGVPTISYAKAMVVTIGLWLAIAPLLGAAVQRMWVRSWRGR